VYWYAQVMKKYAVFSGRARRTEYWMFQLVNFLIALAFGLMLVPLIPSAPYNPKPTGLAVWALTLCAYVLVTIVPGLAVCVRRLHDANLSGLWLLLCLVPMGSVVILVFCLLDGTAGPNQYGPDPKGRHTSSAAMQYAPGGYQAMTTAAGAGIALPGGQPLIGFCTTCGTAMQGGAKFCPNCGKAY